jgi:hypothetical protein
MYKTYQLAKKAGNSGFFCVRTRELLLPRFFFFQTLQDYLPAGRQVGKIYPPLTEKPL